MIDSQTTLFKDKKRIDQSLNSNNKFDLVFQDVNMDSGEFSRVNVNLANMVFSQKPTETTAIGSLHSLYNVSQGRFPSNHDDFTYSQLVYILDKLEKILKYDLSDTKVRRLEMGFNIHIGMNASDFIDEHIPMYKYRHPTKNTQKTKTIKSKRFNLNDYQISIYDKGKETKLPDKYKRFKRLPDTDLLRIEIIYKYDQLQRFGILSLKDLKDKSKLKLLFEDFLSKYEELVIIDCINCRGQGKGMKLKDIDRIKIYTNSDYWKTLSNADYHKKQFKKLIEIYNLDTMKKDLKALIEKKFDYLINN